MRPKSLKFPRSLSKCLESPSSLLSLRPRLLRRDLPRRLSGSGVWGFSPDPREDPKSRFLNEGSSKLPLVVQGPKLGDLLSRSSRGSGRV